jgi:hypothetical protein
LARRLPTKFKFAHTELGRGRLLNRCLAPKVTVCNRPKRSQNSPREPTVGFRGQPQCFERRLCRRKLPTQSGVMSGSYPLSAT